MEILNLDEPRKSLVNVRVGRDVRFFNFVNAYGCSVDDNSKVGAFVEIQKGQVRVRLIHRRLCISILRNLLVVIQNPKDGFAVHVFLRRTTSRSQKY